MQTCGREDWGHLLSTRHQGWAPDDADMWIGRRRHGLVAV